MKSTMNKKRPKSTSSGNVPGREQRDEQSKATKSVKKTSEYGRQLQEKQRVKLMYGMRERQFEKFFKQAKKSAHATGEELLSLLERRIDNVVYRLKFATTRRQARQFVVHGHFAVDGVRVYSPSYLVKVGSVISFAPGTIKNTSFVEGTIEKYISTGVKVPQWLDLEAQEKKGRVVALPQRSDVQATINENFIVEFYSK